MRCRLVSWIEREEGIQSFLHAWRAAICEPNDGGGHLRRQRQAERAQVRMPRLFQARNEVIGQRLHETPVITTDRLRREEARGLLALLLMNLPFLIEDRHIPGPRDTADHICAEAGLPGIRRAQDGSGLL